MLDQLQADIEVGRKAVLAHPLYRALTTEAAVITFMEHHVWAVWDFMSLLKSLQRGLTCVDVPWVPRGPALSRRLINEIVLAEESDETPDGPLSHYELYLAAMRQAGASTQRIEQFIRMLIQGKPVATALSVATPPAPAHQFVAETFWLIGQAPLHAKAAAFAFGRETLIPAMFEQVTSAAGGRLALFGDYLERHIIEDAEHGAMALDMLSELCGDSATRWDDCREAVVIALTARRALWDGTLAAIDPVPF